MINTRELAAQTLEQILEKGGYSHVVLKDVLDKYDYLEPSQKAFVKQLTEGTLERKLQIDYVLDQYASVPVRKMKPFIRILLEMSVYQLLFLDGVPDRAVCDEAVKLAGRRKFTSLKGFINGVLRTISREKENISYPDREKEPVSYLSVRYSCPEWLVKRWNAAYGPEKTEKLLAALLAEHPLSVRFSESLGQEEAGKLAARLEQAGAAVTRHPYLPYAYELRHAGDVRTLPGFAEGAWTVQDVSSMLAAEASGVRGLLARDEKARLLVMDVCAAPGGKALHIASMDPERILVLAGDVSGQKVGRIEENAARMGVTNLQVRVRDASVPEEAQFGKADVVLTDVPCSGLGVLGKKRDIKYKTDEAQIASLVPLQRRILAASAPCVKPGGVLLYCTCTICREENEDAADWFLQEHTDFEPAGLDDCLPPVLHDAETAKGRLQLLPGIHTCDGFFMAKFRRKAAAAAQRKQH